ncbi:hypothetical protein MJO29_009660 [Puccinia striiformis f. sp. tritici]|nr:hypothetical protein MJO29_009660 [Puccinia striiformis f. sp. tritici]
MPLSIGKYINKHSLQTHFDQKLEKDQLAKREDEKDTIKMVIEEQFKKGPRRADPTSRRRASSSHHADNKPIKQISISVALKDLAIYERTSSVSGQVLSSNLIGSWKLPSASDPSPAHSSLRSLTLHLDSLEGLRFEGPSSGVVSLPGFLPSSIQASQLNSASVRLEAFSVNEGNKNDSALEVTSYRLEVIYERSKPATKPMKEEDIIVISSDDEGPKKPTKKVGARIVVDEAEDTKMDVVDAERQKTKYEIICNLIVNQIDLNPHAPEGIESSGITSINVKRENGINESDDESTDPEVITKYLKNCAQLINYMKKQERWIELKLDYVDQHTVSSSLPKDNGRDGVGLNSGTTPTDEPLKPAIATSVGSPSSDNFAPLAPVREISSIAGSEDGSDDSQKEDPSLDFMNFLFEGSTTPPLQDLNISSNSTNQRSGAILTPAVVPPPPPATTEFDSSLENIGDQDVEPTELERALNESNARHSFCNDSNLFHPRSSPSDDCLMGEPASNDLHQDQQSHVDPPSFTPSHSPQIRGHHAPSSQAPDGGLSDRDTVGTPAGNPRTPDLSADIPVPDDMIADIPVPGAGGTPADSPVPRGKAADIPVPAHIPIPGGLPGDTPVRGRVAGDPGPTEKGPSKKGRKKRSKQSTAQSEESPDQNERDSPQEQTHPNMADVSGGLPGDIPVRGGATDDPGPTENGPSKKERKKRGKMAKPRSEENTEENERDNRQGENQPIIIDVSDGESDPEDETYRPSSKNDRKIIDEDDGFLPNDLSNLLKNIGQEPAETLSSEELNEECHILEKFIRNYKSQAEAKQVQVKRTISKCKTTYKEKSTIYSQQKSRLRSKDDNIIEFNQDFRLERESVQEKINQYKRTGLSAELDSARTKLAHLDHQFEIAVEEEEVNILIRQNLEYTIQQIEAQIRRVQSAASNPTSRS